MSKMKTLLSAAVLSLAAGSANAGVISDTGANAYWGGNDHAFGDVIGASMYDIASASVTRVANVLDIRIQTSFAGHAGADTWAASKGIGYGDVFLSTSWKPFGSDAHHTSDKASNGTDWAWGLSLDNRWSNTGGSFTLYELNGSNAADILNSQSFISCALGTACYYRDGQATAVNKASSTVKSTGIQGSWTVLPNAELRFTVNVANTGLSNANLLALHWGETCQNDVIEGLAVVPEPGSLALLGVGLLAFALRRRARAS